MRLIMQTTYYTIYKTTNNIDGKIYIGKHLTRDINNKYLGSGKYLQRAIDKHGIENFTKEILHIFDNEADMNAKEKELVTEEFVLLETNYNLCVGGQGGWSYVNRQDLAVPYFTKENAKTHSVAANQRKQWLSENDKDWAIARSEKMSSALRGRYGTFNGKQHTEETKCQMSESAKGKHIGSKNSQFGTMWITDDMINKKIKKTDSMPHGWHAGRKMGP